MPSSTPPSRRLSHRLGRAFVLQAVVISVTAIVGVWAAALTIERVLIKRALHEEADHYWRLRTDDKTVSPPRTLNLTGYVAQTGQPDGLPDELRDLGPGYHRLDSTSDMTVVYVSERDGDRLALKFDGEQVRELSVLFGLAPLGLVLALLYFAAWVAYRTGRRAISPIEWLARQVGRVAPDRADPRVFDVANMPGNADAEVVALAQALSMLNTRVREFADRERTFTRDASHELRSPLTVIRIASEALLARKPLDDETESMLRRIRRSVSDMEGLTEAFLLLARESELGLSAEPTSINGAVEEVLERTSMVMDERPVSLELSAQCQLEVEASPQVVSVLLDNLVGNAVKFTDAGKVSIRIGERFLEVSDTGVGMSADQLEQMFRPFFRGQDTQPLPDPAGARRPDAKRPRRGGHGVGLTIVQRISDRFGWPVTVESELGRGTRIVVEFPNARVSGTD